MSEKAKFVLDERPETDVYLTDRGFIGIRQVVRGEETIIVLTPDETETVIGYLGQCLHQARAAGPHAKKGLS